MNNIKVAFHQRVGSFTDRWIQFCIEQNIEYLIVDCFDTDIIKQLISNKVTHLMWHINHSSTLELQLFPYVLNAIEKLKIKTFPNFNTRWHFDDKIAQKYLLESIDAPYVESYLFFNKQNALRFIKNINFPIVTKLKRGAGSSNVYLLKNKRDAQKHVNKMFTKGINPVPSTVENLDQKIRLAKKIRNPLTLIKKVINFTKANSIERKTSNNEKGYIFFQRFLPNNDFDTRIIVIGDKAFGVRRFNRSNDFRASGSGKVDYSASQIDTSMIKIAFDVAQNINSQCLAFDFVYDENKSPKIIEVCYGFNMNFYDRCEGFWHKDGDFIHGAFNPQEFMIGNFLNS